jgi:hypothetical protein
MDDEFGFDDFADDLADADMPEEPVDAVESDRPLKRSKSLADGSPDAAAPEDEGPGTEVWQRPPLPELSEATHSIAFQWLSIDVVDGKPLAANPAAGRSVPGSKNSSVPVLHVFGVTDAGNSVLCRIHGFTPYFYFSAPPGITHAHLGGIKAGLEHVVRSGCCLILHASTRIHCTRVSALVPQLSSVRGRPSETFTSRVLAVELVADHRNLMGYHFNRPSMFLRVFVAMPAMVPTAKYVFAYLVTLAY